ncbi:hypothetical protein GCM10010486_81000 [Nonomuraea roseoviolacea subsp. carminata]|uniref:Uncharacterized protein n=1 Tax=Nonomuraea roseoviolacea subsp. carminata TaxID=160689 RepID=A0ABT1JQL5_9ACTN|nr:hypothetical protein [Nonomuraea roseoviolacea subsp. carminata]
MEPLTCDATAAVSGPRFDVYAQITTISGAQWALPPVEVLASQLVCTPGQCGMRAHVILVQVTDNPDR